MEWLPATNADVLKVAVPELSVLVPRMVDPSSKVTVPVGDPEPELLLTVAVKVTDCPKADGLVADVMVVVVERLDWPTVCVNEAELPAKFVSPP